MLQTEGLLRAAIFVLAVVCVSQASWAVGQAVGIKHPVLEHKIDPASAAQYEATVAKIMSMSEEEMLSFVPDGPVRVFCQCPNCYGGSYEGVFSWDVDKPDELVCRYCGTVYPNEKFPEDKVREGVNSQGEAFSYSYYHEPKKNIEMFFTAHIAAQKKNWIVQQTLALGRAYAATGNEEYAMRAALIFDRIAELYPHYPALKQWITTFEFPEKQEPPWPQAGGKWGRWRESEIPHVIPEAYDLVYDAAAFDELSQQRGYDVRERFEKDFLKGTWEYINTWDKFTDNIAPTYLMDAINIGRVINEPHYVHWGYHWLKEILYGGCFYDGMWREAPSYHYQTLGGIGRDFEAMKGYSDPPGYVDAEYGERFDEVDPVADNPFIARAVRAPSVLDFPNGIGSAIHDTWPNERRSDPRTETVSTITPGYGHASLGRGIGSSQLQAQLAFSGTYGHSHLDNLNLTLFAKEREMLCDLGYTHTQVRQWNSNSMSHNLVVVDRQTQNGSGSDGDLNSYFPNSGGISVVEADGERGYREIEGLDLYRRMLVLVPVDASNAYVFDVFRLRGGKTHDWLLHGAGDNDMTAECSVELPGRRENMLEAGEEWVEPRDEQSKFNVWGCMRDMQVGAADGVFSTTFRYTDEPSRGVRTHLMADGPIEVFLGKGLAPRRAKSNTQVAFDYWMPQLVARKTGDAPMSSVFVAIEEPFDGEEFIDAVEPVEIVSGPEGAVAVRVRCGNVEDTIIQTNDEAPYTEIVTASGVRMKGRLGVVREVEGQVSGMWLFDGEELLVGQQGIQASVAAYEGELAGALRVEDGDDVDALVTDAELPVGDVLQGVWMVVTHGSGIRHGYEIERVEERDGKRVVVVSYDHGLRIDGETTEEVYFPARKMAGANRFRISLAVSMTALK